MLAEGTGGRIFGSSDLAKVVKQLRKDAVNTFVVTYLPSVAEGRAGDVRKIQMICKRKQVFTTSTYYVFEERPGVGDIPPFPKERD